MRGGEDRLGRRGSTFIIAGSLANGVDISPVLFCLGMLQGVTIHLGGGGEDKLSVGTLGKSKHVHGSQEACLGSLDRIVPAATATRRKSS